MSMSLISVIGPAHGHDGAAYRLRPPVSLADPRVPAIAAAALATAGAAVTLAAVTVQDPARVKSQKSRIACGKVGRDERGVAVRAEERRGPQTAIMAFIAHSENAAGVPRREDRKCVQLVGGAQVR